MNVTHTFAGGRLHRTSRRRDDVAWIEARRHDPASRFLPFRELRPLVRGTPRLRLAWRSGDGVRRAVLGGAPAVLLGVEGDRAHFAVELASKAGAAVRGKAAYMDLRAAASLLSGPEASLAAQGRSLLAWHAVHRCCARCGSPTVPTAAGYSRTCTAQACPGVHFPRTDPVVIMLVHRQDRCLLGRSVRAVRYPPGLYSCLAGYMEPGESIEEAVRREVEEEAGVSVGHVAYHSSQPWPFPSSLMIGCFAEALSERLTIDPTELEHARWFTRSELAEAIARWDAEAGFRLPPPMTIAHQLAAAWLSGEDGHGRCDRRRHIDRNSSRTDRS